jgi:uncharacterized RDD family membrane protein YckC
MPDTLQPDFNPYAPPETKSEAESTDAGPSIAFGGYAGFGRRFAAALIDGAVTGLVFALVFVGSGAGFAFMMGLVLFLLEWVNLISLDEAPHDNDIWPSLFVGSVLGGAVCVAYHAGMECSASQATLGKMALGVKVTDLHGRRIKFRRALKRCAGKIVSLLILFIGFVMAAFTEKRQSLHDMIAGTLVMKVQGR